MSMPTPARPRIYHILHLDRLISIINDGYLLSDAETIRQNKPGTSIGMSGIKQRRLNELTVGILSDLHVGDCVPFYFCPRSIMLYLIHQANNAELAYKGGQGPIIHLESDLQQTVEWANRNDKRWAFTLSNAGAYYAEFRGDLSQLNEIDWNAVSATQWRMHKEKKQAEFLLENRFPWELVERIGVHSNTVYHQVSGAIANSTHRPRIEVIRDWYY